LRLWRWCLWRWCLGAGRLHVRQARHSGENWQHDGGVSNFHGRFVSLIVSFVLQIVSFFPRSFLFVPQIFFRGGSGYAIRGCPAIHPDDPAASRPLPGVTSRQRDRTWIAETQRRNAGNVVKRNRLADPRSQCDIPDRRMSQRDNVTSHHEHGPLFAFIAVGQNGAELFVTIEITSMQHDSVPLRRHMAPSPNILPSPRPPMTPG
jgi:hypothetical protein